MTLKSGKSDKEYKGEIIMQKLFGTVAPGLDFQFSADAVSIHDLADFNIGNFHKTLFRHTYARKSFSFLLRLG